VEETAALDEGPPFLQITGVNGKSRGFFLPRTECFLHPKNEKGKAFYASLYTITLL
jgi:hypothetical protein